MKKHLHSRTEEGTFSPNGYNGELERKKKVKKENSETEADSSSCFDAATVENQARAVDNVRSIGVKRKASRNKASVGNPKRKKKAGQQSVSTADNPQNLHLLKDMRLADPKCLRIKFLSRHGNLPSKAELLKRFSVFGKIDGSRTDVNRCLRKTG